MIGNRGSLRGGRRKRFSEESINPMENLANLADVMLVFACALMIAIITHWNVDITQNRVNKEDLEPIDDPQLFRMKSKRNNFNPRALFMKTPKQGSYI